MIGKPRPRQQRMDPRRDIPSDPVPTQEVPEGDELPLPPTHEAEARGRTEATAAIEPLDDLADVFGEDRRR